MFLTCAGTSTIELKRYSNVACEDVYESNSTINPGQIKCRLINSEKYIPDKTDEVYYQAQGTALFSCTNATDQDPEAIAELFSSSDSESRTSVNLGILCEEEDKLTLRDSFKECWDFDARPCVVHTLFPLPNENETVIKYRCNSPRQDKEGFENMWKMSQRIQDPTLFGYLDRVVV